MIGSELLRFSNRKLCLFDKETQRVNTQHDNLPFQVSWIVADRQRVHSTHDYYLKWPNYRMSVDAARITRFNPAWVENGHDPEFVLDAFESYAMDPEYLLVGHSILGFDVYIWQLWREALGRKRDWSMLPRVIDTHLLSRAYKEGWKPDRENLLAWQFKVAAAFRKGVKTNLTTMCRELGIEVDEGKTHSAGYDLHLNVQLYWKLIGLMEI